MQESTLRDNSEGTNTLGGTRGELFEVSSDTSNTSSLLSDFSVASRNNVCSCIVHCVRYHTMYLHVPVCCLFTCR